LEDAGHWIGLLQYNSSTGITIHAGPPDFAVAQKDRAVDRPAILGEEYFRILY
jgi:hypothetical protein